MFRGEIYSLNNPFVSKWFSCHKPLYTNPYVDLNPELTSHRAIKISLRRREASFPEMVTHPPLSDTPDKRIMKCSWLDLHKYYDTKAWKSAGFVYQVVINCCSEYFTWSISEWELYAVYNSRWSTFFCMYFEEYVWQSNNLLILLTVSQFNLYTIFFSYFNCPMVNASSD